MASRSIRSAFPDAKIIPNGLRTNDLFHNDPDAENIQTSLDTFFSRLDDLYESGWKRGMELDERIIGKKGDYDLIDAGGNGSWHTTSKGYFTYVNRLQKNTAMNYLCGIWKQEMSPC